MPFLAPVLGAVVGVAKVAAPALISGSLQKKAAEKQQTAQIQAQERVAASQLAAEVELEKRRLELQERQLKFQQEEAAKAAEAARKAQERREELAAFAPTAAPPPIQGGPVVQQPSTPDNTGLLLALLMQSRQTATPAPTPPPQPVAIPESSTTKYLPYIAVGGMALLLLTQKK